MTRRTEVNPILKNDIRGLAVEEMNEKLESGGGKFAATTRSADQLR
jgi:hypothetical protein